MAKKRKSKDFLDEMIEESTARNADFPKLMEAAADRRRVGRDLAKLRERMGLSQTKLAAKMDTSQSQVSKVENGAPDFRISTLERYVAAVGGELKISVKRQAVHHASL
jgi:predicted transcriptional regulator